MSLRPYQQEASDAAIAWIRSCTDPCIIAAATGAGKSHIIADVARRIHAMSKKRILVTAPSAELVGQNHAKFLATGAKASIYSASVRKELVHPVVFGTPGTISNSLRKFGENYAGIIIDEAHGITPTIREIVAHITQQNPRCRVIGLSATPYRMGTGYVYGSHYLRGRMTEEETRDPFFHSCVYEIGPRELIDAGYLTPPVFDAHADGYDTSGLTINSRGQFDAAGVERAFEGHGRLTASIVADVVAKSFNRRGVMLFAATVQHAREVLASLPPHNSAIVTAETPKAERAQILAAFLDKRIKYLVNVAVLTTGFDAPHVDVIAILRGTESAGLLQQIIGRGLRLDAGKADCLVLDYAENIERHCPHGDVFEPVIKVRTKNTGDGMQAKCPVCAHVNSFSARPNPDGYGVNESGEFTDLRGEPLKNADGKIIPAHFGRRCQGESIVAGTHVQCSYTWAHKECAECQHKNDIAARYCSKCKSEIVDPNEKLQIEAAKIASDPYRIQTSTVIGMHLRRWPGKNGRADTLRVDYSIDGNPSVVSQWLGVGSTKWDAFCHAQWGCFVSSLDEALLLETVLPESVRYRKNAATKYIDVLGVIYGSSATGTRGTGDVRAMVSTDVPGNFDFCSP